MASSTAPFASVYEALASAARTRLQKIAIVCEGQRITYEDLLHRIDNAARHLRDLEVGAGDSFALYGQNHPEHLDCYFAAAKSGAVFVPINPNLTESEIAYTFEHSGTKILFHDDHVAEAVRAAVPSDRLLPLSTLNRATAGNDYPGGQVDSSADFLISYSSGTTGKPKAVVLDQAAQINCPIALARMWGITDRDTTLVGLPLGYLYGLSTAAATGLLAGGTVVILRRFHPRDALDAILEHRATIYHGVPTMYSMMLEYCEQRSLSYDLSEVRALICAGAPLPDEMAARFAATFGKELQNYYAMTECTPVFGRYYDEPGPMPADSIGRAAPGTTVKILRPDGTECGPNEPGEALVRGAATMKRYEKDPALTEAMMEGGLFRSGDLVCRDENGFYFIVGRIKDIIICGGHNVSPAEIERVLVAHPAVQDAAVLGLPDRIYGEAPIAFVVLRHGARAGEDELITHVGKQLSDFKVPRTILFVTELPQGMTGKVDKKALKERAEKELTAN